MENPEIDQASLVLLLNTTAKADPQTPFSLINLLSAAKEDRKINLVALALLIHGG